MTSPFPALPVIRSGENVPGIADLINKGEKITIDDLQQFCQLFYVPLDLHGFEDTLPEGHPTIILPSEKVLWEFVHFVELPLLQNPEKTDLPLMATIVAIHRALKLREYIKRKLEDPSVRAPVWSPEAVDKMLRLCEHQLLLYSNDEDMHFAQFRATEDEVRRFQLYRFLNTIGEGWFRLAGVPMGRSVVADAFKRSTEVGPGMLCSVRTTWKLTDE